MIPEWRTFCTKTRGRQPRPILLRSLGYVDKKDRAIDIGAGAMNEARYLLGEGFEVTAIDKEPAVAQEAKLINNKKFHFYPTSYEDFEFPVAKFDLAVALYAFPFAPKAHFGDIIKKTLGSLKPRGVFVGNLFGEKDQWNNGTNNINFVAESAAKELFKGFDILDWQEENGPGQTVSGETKHWNIFHIIAKRR